MPTKVAFFLPNLGGGGAQKVLVTLANSLAENNYSVDFVLSSCKGPYLSSLNSTIDVHDLGHQHVAASFFDLARYLRDHKPAVLISGISNANAAALLASSLFLRSCKVIITQHTNWSQILLDNPSQKERVVYHLSKYLYPLAARIVAVSSGIADEVRQMENVPSKTVLCIHNPVVTSELIELATQLPAHHWLAQKDTPVVLAVGRLAKEKDFETLIRAFHQVQMQVECKLVILGEGPERPTLESLVRELKIDDRVDLPGFIQNPYAYMAQADLFVLSSRFEGLPTVLIEALACGTEVVATDCISGPAEILENGRYGRLIPVGDVGALSKAIVDSLAKPLRKAVLQERAELYSVANATAAYARLIEQVIAPQ